MAKSRKDAIRFATQPAREAKFALTDVRTIASNTNQTQLVGVIDNSVALLDYEIAIHDRLLLEQQSVDGQLILTFDRKLDKGIRITHASFVDAAEQSEFVGLPNPFPNLVLQLWPNGVNAFITSSFVAQAVETDRLLHKLEEQQLALYADDLGLTGTLSNLRIWNNQFTELLSKLSDDSIADKLKAANLNAKEGYFQAVTAIGGLAALGNPVASEMFLALRAHDDNFLAARARRLAKKATQTKITTTAEVSAK